MDAAPIQIFRLLAAEFSEVGADVVTEWLQITEPFVSKKGFGKMWAQALALLTAHRMKLAGVGMEPGSDPLAEIGNISAGGFMRVGSYSEGETSISFNTSLTQYAELNAELALTQYGVQYLSLRRMRIMSITSAGESNGRA